jgi:hypothetical protein
MRSNSIRIVSLSCAVLLSACHTGLPGFRPRCSAAAPAEAIPYDSTRWIELKGEFNLVDVLTSQGPKAEIARSRIRLDTVRLAERWYRNQGLRGPVGPERFRPVVGTSLSRTGGLTSSEEVEVEGTVLHVGCRRCSDASPTHYTIEAISPRGFWGHWRNYQSGIVYVRGPNGERLPDPAGYFCAFRR